MGSAPWLRRNGITAPRCGTESCDIKTMVQEWRPVNYGGKFLDGWGKKAGSKPAPRGRRKAGVVLESGGSGGRTGAGRPAHQVVRSRPGQPSTKEKQANGTVRMAVPSSKYRSATSIGPLSVSIT